jgi:hypothetical protein
VKLQNPGADHGGNVIECLTDNNLNSVEVAVMEQLWTLTLVCVCCRCIGRLWNLVVALGCMLRGFVLCLL